VLGATLKAGASVEYEIGAQRYLVLAFGAVGVTGSESMRDGAAIEDAGKKMTGRRSREPDDMTPHSDGTISPKRALAFACPY
jgi:hypothetical protein